mgnify:CR=1 FL=1
MKISNTIKTFMALLIISIIFISINTLNPISSNHLVTQIKDSEIQKISNFQIINEIIISKANLLNKNKIPIKDLTNELKKLDNLWTPTIYSNQYIRITFSQKLTNNNDITIFPNIISGNPIIEVYEENSNIQIAKFSNIQNNQYNKIYLTSLKNPQDTFDLLIKQGTLKLNQIIDPSTFYDPISDLTTGWNDGSGTTFDEINDAIRQPTTPETSTNLQSRANDGLTSEFNFNLTNFFQENMVIDLQKKFALPPKQEKHWLMFFPDFENKVAKNCILPVCRSPASAD